VKYEAYLSIKVIPDQYPPMAIHITDNANITTIQGSNLSFTIGEYIIRSTDFPRFCKIYL
jgi:hypothetical protein